MIYAYTVSGRAANDQTWEVSGEVSTDNPGAFKLMIDAALRASFETLTQGKAVHGKPGVGCSGPYQITALTIKEVDKIADPIKDRVAPR